MMKTRLLAFLALTALLSACETGTQLKSRLGLEQQVVLDKVNLDQTRTDVTTHGFPEPEVNNLIEGLLTKAVQQPGPHPYVPLVAANGGNLYVGATSSRAAHHAVDTELVVKERSRGVLHVYATWEDRGDVWAQKPGSYRVELEPPATSKKSDSKHGK